MAPVRPVNGLGKVKTAEVTETIVVTRNLVATTATAKELIAETSVTETIAETGVTVKGTV